VGGGVIRSSTTPCPQALIKLGYTRIMLTIVTHIDSTGTIEGAPT